MASKKKKNQLPNRNIVHRINREQLEELRIQNGLADRANRISIASTVILLVSAVAAFFGIKAAMDSARTDSDYYFSPASIHSYAPSGYAISRGLFVFRETDHLIVPIEWENSGGHAGVVRDLILTLTNSKSDQDPIRFFYAGTVPEISTDVLGEGNGEYTIERSFIVPSHNIITKIMVFHIENWYSSGSTFNFPSESCYRVEIEYSVNSNDMEPRYLFDLRIYGVDRLGKVEKDVKQLHWDFWGIGASNKCIKRD